MRTLLALAAITLAFGAAYADFCIRVETTTGKPLENADVRVQTLLRVDIDKGASDKKGEFVSKKLPGRQRVVRILVDPAETDYIGACQDVDVTTTPSIVIRVPPKAPR
jgi:hypothetical protein